MPPVPLSFGSTVWTFSWIPPYEDGIRRVAAAGCQSFELSIWNREAIDSYYTKQRIQDLKSLARDEGLTLSNIFCNLNFSSKPGDKSSRADLDGFRKGVETAAELGSPLITTSTPYPFGREITPILRRPISQLSTADVEPQWNWTAEYNQCVDSLAKACEFAADARLKVAIEPHPYRWVNSAQSMARLLERTGSPNLGFNFDPSHLFPSGDMPHFTVLMLGDRIFNTHLSDNDGQTNAHWRPGRGKIDWVAILSALEAIGYKGPLTLELEDVPGASHWTHTDPATRQLEVELKKSIQFLRDQYSELHAA
ncbi:MAG TPA: sugar phosphate isomerase/epimerase family protein [Acidisoma sp.]|uniref:sugar phosphate isomerase/epimerase family protein n=1 Tax=Acidisoma sp. TaxID=1872115 RepID=UPI002CEDFA26|nr:sugar phosphate isomerase/epimerase family protein [Acidisoma sp.]HTI01111.1 sugar phosphate isomerase/epimerase family protein [Acidisoma sp.]